MHKRLRTRGNPATDKAYLSDQANFIQWCRANRKRWKTAKPADISEYLLHLKSVGLSSQTIGRRLAALGELFVDEGRDPPPTAARSVSATVHEIRNELPDYVAYKIRIKPADRKRMMELCDDSLRGLRDRPILALTETMRRSEIYALTVKDIPALSEDIRDMIVPYQMTARIKSGPLFRPIKKGGRIQPTALSAHSINQIVVRYAERAGLPKGFVSSKSMR